MAPMLRALALAAALPGILSITGCSMIWPEPDTTPKSAYETDTAACDTAAAEAVAKRNAKTGLAWFASPITRWSRTDDNASACMAAKGWALPRACTDEERRKGAAAPGLVVTANGIRCSDPGKTP